MSGGSAVEHIDAVDAFARTLNLRTQQSLCPALESLSVLIRSLHIALRHLRIEAADPDSLLNNPDDEAALYTRQLRPLVEDCEFTFKQLETIMDKYDSGNVDLNENDEGKLKRVEAIKTKLTNGKTSVDMFLDTVQLQKLSKKAADGIFILPPVSGGNLEGIKDTVDAVATKVFSRRDNNVSDDEDDCWRDFKGELEKEGFSPQVLHKHKDVLRAYIRELESMCTPNGGPPPTVRGLLEYETKSQPATPRAVELPAEDNGRYFPYMGDIQNQRSPDPNHIFLPPPPVPSDSFSFEHHSSDESDDRSHTSDSLALISTKDLMAMDNMNRGMADMHLQPSNGQNYNYVPPGTTQRYLPPPNVFAGALPAPPNEAEYSSSMNPQLLGSAPQYLPPPQSGTSPTTNGSAYFPPQQQGRAPPRLAPDRYGLDIPLEAQWTRVRRTLISPEVLARAGVRYEARPDYVAILGRLSREDIAEYARQSADARAARNMRNQPPPPPAYSPAVQSPQQSFPPPAPSATTAAALGAAGGMAGIAVHNSISQNRSPNRDRGRGRGRDRSNSKSSQEADDESVLWDESDTTDLDDDKTNDKGHRSYQYIVDPPAKENGKYGSTSSPSSTAMPKPILKNKNENHVRFDPQPHEVSNETSRSPRRRDPRDHSGRRQSHSDHRDRRNGDSLRPSGERRGRRDSERHSSVSGATTNGSSDRHRDDDYHRSSHKRGDRRDREDRAGKKKAWGETLGAVGIGGAAVSLLGVLAEAASGM